MLSTALDVETMMSEFVSAIGSSPNIVGFNIIDFCSPFFKMAGFNSGYMPDLSSAIDLMSIAKATLPLGSYKLKTICKALGINEADCLSSVVSSKANMKFEVFKQICSLVPAGTEVAEILDMKYWKKSYNCRFIYVYTNFGKVAFNCKTLYWQECDDGFFDVVDLDKLSLTICQTYNCANMFEFVKKFEAKQGVK